MKLHHKIDIVATVLAYDKFSKEELYQEIKWLLEQVYKVKKGIEIDYEFLFNAKVSYKDQKRYKTK